MYKRQAWSTVGRYNLLSRLLRGGLSGSGDVHHPANTTFKVRRHTPSFSLIYYHVLIFQIYIVPREEIELSLFVA